MQQQKALHMLNKKCVPNVSAQTLESLATARIAIDEAITTRFDGDPKKLVRYGLMPSDHELALHCKLAMHTSGKRVRGWLLQAWYKAQGGEDLEAAQDAAVIIEALHMATLVIDDVQDNSSLRRGQPTLFAERGTAVAISTGLSLLYGATEASRHLPNGERIQPLIVEYVTQLAHGQAKDVIWHRDGSLSVTQHAYERMCSEKTAKLFILSTRMAEAMAGPSIQTRAMAKLRERAPVVERYFPNNSKRVAEALDLVGVAYQLADDIANITTDIGKDSCEDIRERKITALVVQLQHHGPAPARKALQQFYRKRGVSETDIKAVAQLFRDSGTIEAVDKRITELTSRIAVLIEEARLEESSRELMQTLLAISVKR